jgi:hypothetical protein
MIKKGKSCLLKLPCSTLQMHLANTPMYVMIIDSYPEIPKLLGNTTVALDQEMRDIMEDIRRLGDTVPSVHGDKGLFKVFPEYFLQSDVIVPEYCQIDVLQ